jgi:hypothetical protein
MKPPRWTYSGYRATLRLDGQFFAFVTPEGKKALSKPNAEMLLACLNRAPTKVEGYVTKAMANHILKGLKRTIPGTKSIRAVMNMTPAEWKTTPLGQIEAEIRRDKRNKRAKKPAIYRR